MTAVTIDPSGAFLTLKTPTTASSYHAIWLRDNARDPETRAAGNGQRLITMRDIPVETRIARADLQGDRLEITFAPEGKTISYDLGWLEANAYDHDDARRRGWTAPEIET